MSSVVDGLRNTPKGQLVYTRNIEGRVLENLFHKCTSAPKLSRPHTEITPPRPVKSASFGLSYADDSGEVDSNHDSSRLDHQYTEDAEKQPCSYGEKGEQDSLEKENHPRGVSVDQFHWSRVPGLKGTGPHSPLSPKLGGSPSIVSPKSPKTVSHTHSQIQSPGGSQATSPKSPPTPKSPQYSKSLQGLKSPQSGRLKSPQSPHQPVSPESSPLVNPVRVYVVEEDSPPDATFSPCRKEREDLMPSKSPPVTWTLDSSRANESGSVESSDEENEEMDDPLHDSLTLSFTEKLRVIVGLEMEYDNQTKEYVGKKQEEFLSHQSHLESQQRELVSAMEQRHLQDISQVHQSIEKQQQSKRPEMQQAVQRVKETHQHCSRRQDARQQQVEQLSQCLIEEKAKKEQAMEQKLQEARAVAQRVTANKTAVLEALEQCPHKQFLAEVAEKTKLLVRKLSEQAEALAGGLTRAAALEDVLTRLKQFHEQSQNAVDFVRNLTADAEKKAKAAAEAERQRQQATAAQPQPPQAGQANPTSQGGQAPAPSQSAASGEEEALLVVAREYENNLKLLTQIDAAIGDFISNQQMKKVRFDLQRAVNTPLNAVSPVSSRHLRDKLLRIGCLLKGETVPVLDRQVSVHATPHGLAFCKNLVAKMIVKKADEQVSSNHESAFAIAAVAVGLWTEFPDVGELIMAHMQALCPYVLPFYPPRLPNQSSEDYHRSLGYKIVDGSIEQQDKFLKRMSGILRLYAAIMVTSPPQGGNVAHPHGIEHAWVWLTRSMNLQPNPDITATAIYDILHVTGNFLLRAYRIQFVKLLYFLYKGFLPKLKDVAAGSGPVIRLETFLETTMKNNALIPEPEGYLSPNFLRS